MSNVIRLNSKSPTEEWISMSNQGTDCFLELLINATTGVDLTENQKRLFSFLARKKDINNDSPGCASFDIDEMPWSASTLEEDKQFIQKICEKAKDNRLWVNLGYEPDGDLVIPWLDAFAGWVGHIEACEGIECPGGRFELLINGEVSSFVPVHVTDFGIDDEDGTLCCPDEMYNIWLSAADFKKGDVIVGRMVDIPISSDTTDERTINMIGVKDGITYGLGTIDLTWEPADWKLIITDVIEDGFKLTFKGGLKDYPRFKADYRFFFIVAWMKGDGDKEYDVISYCTC